MRLVHVSFLCLLSGSALAAEAVPPQVPNRMAAPAPTVSLTLEDLDMLIRAEVSDAKKRDIEAQAALDRSRAKTVYDKINDAFWPPMTTLAPIATTSPHTELSPPGLPSDAYNP